MSTTIAQLIEIETMSTTIAETKTAIITEAKAAIITEAKAAISTEAKAAIITEAKTVIVDTILQIADVKLLNGKTKNIELMRSDFTPKSLIVIDHTDLICPICHEIPTHPIVFSCSHTVCTPCSNELLVPSSSQSSSTNKPSYKCPACRTISIAENPQFVKRVIMGLNVYCKNKIYGCTWNGDLGDECRNYIKHYVGCLMGSKLCVSGCGVMVDYGDEKLHKDIDCMLVSVKCEHKGCNESVLRRDYKSHISSCKYRLVDCEFKLMLDFNYLSVGNNSSSSSNTGSSNSSSIIGSSNSSSIISSSSSSMANNNACNNKIQYRYYKKHLYDYMEEHLSSLKMKFTNEAKKLTALNQLYQALEKDSKDNKIEIKKLSDDKSHLENEVKRLTLKSFNKHRWVIKDLSKLICKEQFVTGTEDFYLYGQIWRLSLIKSGRVIRFEHGFPYISSNLKINTTLEIVNPRNLVPIHNFTTNRVVERNQSWGGELTFEKIDNGYDRETDSIYIDLIVNQEPELVR